MASYYALFVFTERVNAAEPILRELFMNCQKVNGFPGPGHVRILTINNRWQTHSFILVFVSFWELKWKLLALFS